MGTVTSAVLAGVSRVATKKVVNILGKKCTPRKKSWLLLRNRPACLAMKNVVKVHCNLYVSPIKLIKLTTMSMTLSDLTMGFQVSG